MSSSSERVQANLTLLDERMTRACEAAGRSRGEVTLVAVSKTFEAAAVLAATQAGQRQFGENYVQEMVEKQEQLRVLAPHLQLVWHLIGPLQSNKTRVVAEQADWVQSVDRLKIAQRLSEQRPPALAPLQVLIQVNISGELSKSGVAPDEVTALAAAITELPRLRLRGLMAVPQPDAAPTVLRQQFAQMRQLFDRLRVQHGEAIDTLSLGMSADLELAIAEGATLVRIGTAIFGTRSRAAQERSA
jgi:PLP dependent protein